MYIAYGDILSRIEGQPLWWLYGVPRYQPFSPQDVGVYETEVALVHTECQQCGIRYDVAVRPAGLGRRLRNVIAYENQLDIGDPPNACGFLGSNCGSGATMSSLQIAILEFWVKEGHPIPDWRRDESMERLLVDGHRESVPVFLRIANSIHKDDWMRARNEGNIPAMVSILGKFNREQPLQVAHMLDLERRQSLFHKEIIELGNSRFPEP